MLTARELSHGIFGAWRLARLDPGGMRYFDNSMEGLWKSFWAAVVILPVYLYLAIDELVAIENQSGFLWTFVVEASGYTIDWVAYPLVMVYLCETLGRRDDYIRYIVARNWAVVLEVLAQTSAHLLVDIGVVPQSFAILLSLAVLFALLTYEWYIAKVALSLDGLTAAGLIFVSTVISLFIRSMELGLLL